MYFGKNLRNSPLQPEVVLFIDMFDGKGKLIVPRMFAGQICVTYGRKLTRYAASFYVVYVSCGLGRF